MKNDAVSITIKILLLMAYLNQNFTKEIRQVQRCPSRGERKIIRKHHNCSSNQVYHCLLDDDKLLKETCNDYIQLPPGNFPKYLSFSDRVSYAKCPSDRYQPWPVLSYEITECEVLKSTCSGLGQVVCNHGDAVTDAKCGCDYKSGYVPGGSSSCCSPSVSTDCYCSFRPCYDDRQELNADYKCVQKCQNGFIRPEGKNDCERDTNTTRLDVTTGYAISFPYGGITEPIGLSVYRVNPEMNYRSVIAILLVLTSVGIVCCFVCIINHHLVQKRTTWNEEYEKRIYEFIESAKKGDIERVKSIIKERYIDIYETDINQRSALHLAACEGHVDVVKLLLKHGGYVKTKDRCMEFNAGEDAEWHSEHHSDRKLDYEKIIEKLAKTDVSKRHTAPKKYFKKNIAIQLITAAEQGDENELRRLFYMNTDMNLADSIGRTALHAAVSNGHLNAVQFLLDTCGVSPFSRLKSGERPIQQAQQNDIIKILESTMNDHIDYKYVHSGNDSMTMRERLSESLMITRMLKFASEGNLKQLKRLKALHFDLSMSNYDKRTALHVAVSNDQEHIVEYLLNDGNVKENAEDRWHITPLMIAKGGKRNMFNLFLEHCPNVVNTESDEYKTFLLLKAGKEGDVKKLEQLRKNGVGMDVQDYDGRTALHLAVAENKEKAIKYLKEECCCSCDITDRYGYTPYSTLGQETIHYPTMEKMERVGRTNKQYQDSAKTGRGDLDSSIQTTAKKSWMDRASSIKTRSSSKRIQVTDKSSMYMIFEAAVNGDIVALERCSYPYYDAIDYFKNTPLHVAASVGHIEVAKFLIEKQNASPFVRNSVGKRPEDLVEDKIECLVSMAGTVSNLLQRRRFTKLRSYLNTKTSYILESGLAILDKSFPKYEQDAKIFMLLNKTYKGDILYVKGYIQEDPTLINQCDYDGRTALHIAVAEMHAHLVSYFLIELKDVIDINLKDRWGNTPMEEAETYQPSGHTLEEYKNIIQLIKNFKDDSGK